MISFLQATVLGLLQGVSELFPISSLGHSVILPKLLGWNIHQNDPYFLSFLVATHVSTAIVLFFFFFKDWMKIIAGILRSLKKREIQPSDTDAKLGWLLIIGTIPAGFIGLLLEDVLRSFFASASSASFFLLLNGTFLFFAERIRRKRKEVNTEVKSDQRIAKLSFKQALAVGTMQILALIPGLSRTGLTIAGSLLVGLSHEDSLRYSFLLATPIIAAAGFLKLPDLLVGTGRNELPQALVGGLFAAVSAFVAVKFLLKFFQTKTLLPFAAYCFVVGGILFLLLR